MKLLIVEDDRSTAEMVKAGLASHSHTVEIASDGADGSFMGRSFAYDAILLDYALPKKDGLTVCKEIRASGRATPILFLSVTDDTSIKVTALNIGADDFVTKPFSIEELNARIGALARRPETIKDTILQVHDLVLDPEHQTVTRAGTEIRATRKEFCLLEYLMKHPGTILSRAMIMEHVWTADSNPFTNTVEAHIRNLRKKLNAGGKQNLIANIPGRGYIIDAPERLARL